MLECLRGREKVPFLFFFFSLDRKNLKTDTKRPAFCLSAIALAQSCLTCSTRTMLRGAVATLAVAALAASIDWTGVYMRCAVRLPLGSPPADAVPRTHVRADPAALSASSLRSATTHWAPTIVGGESFAFDEAGTLYTGSANGTVWAVRAAGAAGSRPRALAHLGGRPVGMAWDAQNARLLVACAVKGLLALDPASGRTTLLATHAQPGPDPDAAPGGLVTFANSVVALPPGVGGAGRSGGALFTTSMSTPPPPPSVPGAAWQPPEAATAALFSGVPSGKVVRYDEASGVATVLAGGLWFANGVALAPPGGGGEGPSAIVAETMAGRLVRVDLGTGRVSHFAALPGFPDGVAPAPGGPGPDSLWVALVEAPGPPAAFLATSRPARWLASRLPAYLAARAAPPVGLVVRVSAADGAVLETLADAGGRVVRGVTSAVEGPGRRLWLGSLAGVGVQSVQLG